MDFVFIAYVVMLGTLFIAGVVSFLLARWVERVIGSLLAAVVVAGFSAIVTVFACMMTVSYLSWLYTMVVD